MSQACPHCPPAPGASLRSVSPLITPGSPTSGVRVHLICAHPPPPHRMPSPSTPAHSRLDAAAAQTVLRSAWCPRALSPPLLCRAAVRLAGQQWVKRVPGAVGATAQWAKQGDEETGCHG